MVLIIPYGHYYPGLWVLQFSRFEVEPFSGSRSFCGAFKGIHSSQSPFEGDM